MSARAHTVNRPRRPSTRVRFTSKFCLPDPAFFSGGTFFWISPSAYPKGKILVRCSFHRYTFDIERSLALTVARNGRGIVLFPFLVAVKKKELLNVHGCMIGGQMGCLNKTIAAFHTCPMYGRSIIIKLYMSNQIELKFRLVTGYNIFMVYGEVSSPDGQWRQGTCV